MGSFDCVRLAPHFAQDGQKERKPPCTSDLRPETEDLRPETCYSLPFFLISMFKRLIF